MSSWVEELLRNAETLMRVDSQDEIAQDLRRLRDHLPLIEMQVFRDPVMSSLADKVSESDSIEELQSGLADLSERFSVNTCTVHLIHETGGTTYEKKVITNCSAGWATEYVRMNLSSIDPIIEKLRTTSSDFYWDEIDWHDPFSSRFLKASIAYGVGPAGFSTIGKNKYGDLIALSASSKSTGIDFRRDFGGKKSDFVDIASLFFEAFTDIIAINHESSIILTDDQVRVLYALATGADLADLRASALLYGSFDNVERSILRAFSARTLTQAVAISSEMGILKNLPYGLEDIFSLCDIPPPASI